MDKQIKDGVRVYLDSMMLNDILRRTDATEIKRLLRNIIDEQEKLVVLHKGFNIKRSGIEIEEAKETHGKIFYYCDRERCDKCNTDCDHTSDITHARNFEKDECGNYFEGEYIRG